MSPIKRKNKVKSTKSEKPQKNSLIKTVKAKEKKKVKKSKIVSRKTETKPGKILVPEKPIKKKGIKKALKPVSKVSAATVTSVPKKPAKKIASQSEIKPVSSPQIKIAPAVKPFPPKPAVPRQKIKIDESITVSDLASKMNIRPAELIKKMMLSGILLTINQRVATDVASVVAGKFGYDVEVVPLYGDVEEEVEEDKSKLVHRAPIVTIMGHVDHGKTSLMDAIRLSNVVASEAGGITQHIGAYKVKTPGGEIVFLDTPGHEAFTAMRARGAQVTDIVVLVVAADDGVMPQTIEAIDHARAANVPIIVAINKIDMPAANVQKVKQELSNQNLQPEDWGGKTITVEVSAKKRIGIEKLLELILLQAEIMELKANPKRPALGVIVEAKVSSKQGPVATVLIKTGTIKVGDYFVAGTSSGKVRAMHNDRGKRLFEAGPSTPVEIMGFQWAPQSGDKFFVVNDEKEARNISEIRQQSRRDEKLSRRKHLTLEDFHKNRISGKAKELALILKADVRGSVEVLRDSLEKLSTSEVTLKIIHSGIGGINDSDVILAAASDAVIIGFNVRSETTALSLAQREEVEIKTYRIIYEAINEVKAAMEGLLEPDKKEVYVGRARVLKTFKVAKTGTIAGCLVIDGKISRTGGARLLRDNAIIYEGKLASLKRFKDDVKEVEKGFECGTMLENFGDIKEGDVIESFAIELVKRKL
ncbi:MAG: translation initiation factor IF-2 [Elusimicrobia bacterium CG06_land_8_20_14_3_00_38_11]|nr:MAG: translation initiation factor IF-2 [Elusimicrobia bacterium CG06_land_8_20_14_3_00_38_11]